MFFVPSELPRLEHNVTCGFDKICRQKANLRVVSSNSLAASFILQKVVTEDVDNCGALWSLTPHPGSEKRILGGVIHPGPELVCRNLFPLSL